ncbi:MAG TPA: glycosyltransferase, partial [Pedobacter sp.]|nr:glycosyltransferase [Pedobacter sp.]
QRGRSNEKPRTKNNLLIHIHSWWNLVTIFSCLVAKLNRVPVVLSPRGMLTNYTQNNRNSFFKATLHELIGKSLLKYVHIIASSEQEKQDVLKIIKPKSITVLPNLVSLPKEQEIRSNDCHPALSKETTSTSNNEQPFNLLFLSRIEEKKGLDILFDALEKLTIPWTLNIAGNGEETYLESLKLKAKSLKIDSQITWLGQISNSDKFELIAKHDLLVLTSYNENFANVVIESLYVGTPVFVSKEVGLSNYVDANNLGFITSLDSQQIANDLNEAYLRSDKRELIRLQAPAIISHDFDEEVLSQKYIKLYQQILNEP